MNINIPLFLRVVTALALIVALVGLLTGCGLAPRQIDATVTHVSHPLLGPPFGPANEEDSLDTVGACAKWGKGRVTLEQCLGYRYADGGFYGDDFIYEGRVSVKLWERN